MITDTSWGNKPVVVCSPGHSFMGDSMRPGFCRANVDSTQKMVTALKRVYPDLHITFAGSYDVKTATEHQVCDGSGRDGFVLASGKTRKEAITKAYKERVRETVC